MCNLQGFGFSLETSPTPSRLPVPVHVQTSFRALTSSARANPTPRSPRLLPSLRKALKAITDLHLGNPTYEYSSLSTPNLESKALHLKTHRKTWFPYGKTSQSKYWDSIRSNTPCIPGCPYSGRELRGRASREAALLAAQEASLSLFRMSDLGPFAF